MKKRKFFKMSSGNSDKDNLFGDLQEDDEFSFHPKKAYELENLVEKSIEDFSSLLLRIEGVDEKLKTLWKQIYDNAVTDRKNAYLVWTDLYIQVHSKEEMHFKHGTVLAKYMERMEKANEQILKLAMLVDKAQIKSESEDFPSANDIFSKNEKKFQKK